MKRGDGDLDWASRLRPGTYAVLYLPDSALDGLQTPGVLDRVTAKGLEVRLGHVEIARLSKVPIVGE